jgi:hypothetical protein
MDIADLGRLSGESLLRHWSFPSKRATLLDPYRWLERKNGLAHMSQMDRYQA